MTKCLEPNEVGYREIHDVKGQAFTLIFRIVPAENRHLGLQGRERLKEQGGREIDLLEGIVLLGPNSEILVTDKDLQNVYTEVERVYKDFWKSEDSFEHAVSKSIFLNEPDEKNTALP